MKDPDGLIPLPLLGAAMALSFVLLVVLIATLAQPRGCPAGSYDGYRATGCYRSFVVLALA